MLNAIAQLAEHLVGNVQRVLRDEIDAYALRADQSNNLLDPIEQSFGGIVKEQVSFIKEEA